MDVLSLLTPAERAFVKAQRLLKELREMGQPLASFTLYSDSSGYLTIRTPSEEVRAFVVHYLRSTRWNPDTENGYVRLMTCHGLLNG